MSLLDIFELFYHFHWITITSHFIEQNFNIKFEINDNQVLFHVNFSDYSPFIRLWIVFLDWSFMSKLTNIWYKDMRNLSSPSDCIQFSVSDNKRMTVSSIVHIGNLRNSIVNWSWGVETLTGFESIRITKYIMMHYLSWKINDFCPPVM